MNSSLTVTIHGQCLGDCQENGCEREAHVYISIGSDTHVVLCMEHALDSVQDAMLNIAAYSVN